MALKLDIKNDTLIPSQAFKTWADEVLTERGMETSVQIPVIGALFKRNKNLQGKLEELKTKIDRCPAGSDVWFSKMFLWPFGGKVTDDANPSLWSGGNICQTACSSPTPCLTRARRNGKRWQCPPNQSSTEPRVMTQWKRRMDSVTTTTQGPLTLYAECWPCSHRPTEARLA